MRRGLFYFVICWHFTCMLTHNVGSTLRGYQQLTEPSGSGYLLHLQDYVTKFTTWPPARHFAGFAGTATGYGFFAPRVASSFQLEVTSIGDSSDVQAYAYGPALRHPHSHLRYHSLLSRLQHLLDEADGVDEDVVTLRKRQARAIAHCLSQRIARQRWGSTPHAIRCTVYVYQHQPLWQWPVAPPGQHLSVYQKEFAIHLDHDPTIFL